MLVLTLALFMSFTFPPLEELIQRSEPWVRDDYTVTTQFEFHTSDFLRSDEEILLLHHAFLDDENETLRTVVCTETRVIVLEEGVVEREIELLARPVVLKASPSGRYISMHREQDVPSDVRAFRVDTETGEQRFFDAFPGENPLNTWSYIHDDGQLFSVCNGQSWVFDHELNPSDGPRVGIGYTTPYAYSREADIMYIPALRSAYNRRGDLLWTLPEEYSSSRVNQATVSDDGSLVGLATRDGLFLIDGVTGEVLDEFFAGLNVAAISMNPTGNRLLVRLQYDSSYVTSSICLITGEQYSLALSPRVRDLLNNGISLVDSIVLDQYLDPYYVPGRHIYTISSSGKRLVQASNWFPTHSGSEFLIFGIESVLPSGFQIVELQERMGH